MRHALDVLVVGTRQGVGGGRANVHGRVHVFDRFESEQGNQMGLRLLRIALVCLQLCPKCRRL